MAPQERYTFGALAEAAGFLALYPEGLADSASGWTSWQLGVQMWCQVSV